MHDRGILVAMIERMDAAGRFYRLRLLSVLVFLATAACIAIPAHAQAADANPFYARKNSFGIFFAYSGDSSHILMGYAEQRRLLNLGVSYSRRLWMNHLVNWQYDGEFMPVALESDPIQYTTATVTFSNPPSTLTNTTAIPTVLACQPSSGNEIGPGGVTLSYTTTCGRRWVIGEAMSPIGFEWNFLPRRRVQPFLDGHGGYMYSTQKIPINEAGSFNFTFDFGAGFELYRTQRQSIRAEYGYHHLSNHNTASQNPGVDNGLLQVTYCFGR